MVEARFTPFEDEETMSMTRDMDGYHNDVMGFDNTGMRKMNGYHFDASKA